MKIITKDCFKVISILAIFSEAELKKIKFLVNKLIMDILLYSLEIWRWVERDKIERMHILSGL